MKLFLDDLRALPAGEDFVLVTTGEDFMARMERGEVFDEYWFDHDLGVSKYNGHQCLERLIEECELYDHPKPHTIVIHTSNTWEMKAMGARVERYFGPGVLRYENGLYMPIARAMKIVSTHRPAIVHWPDGRYELVAGTIDAVNGVKPTSPVLVGESFTLCQVTWALAKTTPTAPGDRLTREVAGSKPGATYTVTTMPGGRQMCTCPGYGFRRTCKHVTA